MLRILLFCACLSLILTSVFPEGDSPETDEYFDSISIFIAVIVVSCTQSQINYRKQKSEQEITKMKNDFNINVIREGSKTRIKSTEVLVGDILSLKEGDRVSGDGFYISGRSLMTNNSQETGESAPVEVNEYYPFVLDGVAIVSGSGRVLVAAVGQGTQSGSHMQEIQEMKQEQTSLQEKLHQLEFTLLWTSVIGAILTFAILFIFWLIDVIQNQRNRIGFSGQSLNLLIRSVMIAITIFICTVPEGLPLAVTLSLGFSMKKMMKDHNFVRHLHACETMRSATTICSDKTGTLTQNNMKVVKFFMDDEEQGEDVNLSENVQKLFIDAITINSTAYSTTLENQSGLTYVGCASECALLKMLPAWKADYKKIRSLHPLVKVYKFSSVRKKMSTIIRCEDFYRVFVKGAPDIVLRQNTHYLRKDGTRTPLTSETFNRITQKIPEFSDLVLRTLLICFRDFETTKEDLSLDNAEDVEQDLTMIGLVGIEDPLRPEVIEAIQKCDLAGITVRMITGDHFATAKAIVNQCGILKDDSRAMLSEEWSHMSNDDLIRILPKLRVLARSSPADKLRLVSQLMETGEVVAVTGDGSNDDLALRKANVGLSMGQCGTELARLASDIVILDDYFRSIVSALKWGRCVYDNVRAFLQFELTAAFSAMVIAFLGAASSVNHHSQLFKYCRSTLSLIRLVH
jgi:Ca2+-transporting ATPase